MFRTKEIWNAESVSLGNQLDEFQCGSMCVGNIDNSSDRASM